MDAKYLEQQLITNFRHKPTNHQSTAINHIARFHCSSKPNPCYVLKGYAGTGKTSLMATYVKTMAQMRHKIVLLAPTGRAAKVLSAYAGRIAHTIHRFIYFIVTAPNGYPVVKLNNNKLSNTTFIVDEASMIGDNSNNSEGGFGGRVLLDDLIQYVFSQSGNKLILIGDTAQLPPVGLNISPALDINYLKTSFNLTAHSFEMKEVMRQSLDSGILASATSLREKIENEDSNLPMINLSDFKSEVKIIESAMDFEEILQESFTDSSDSDSVLICRSNKRANLFNQQIRANILQRENELEAGDILMVVKNNYYWMEEYQLSGFIANGEMLEVRKIMKIRDLYGFRFADAEIALVDQDEIKTIEVKILLDTINAEGAGLSREQQNTLFENILEDFTHLGSRKKAVQQVMVSPYFNAIHVKFAYAMTCHKTQGGQWPKVIIDQGWLTEEMINSEYLRWLYTAFTRATESLYLINFREDFFE